MDILFTLVDPESKTKAYENHSGGLGHKLMRFLLVGGGRVFYNHPGYGKCNFVMSLVSPVPSGEGTVGHFPN